MPTPTSPLHDDELSIDDLAGRSRLPSRTIREYQTMGLLPPPERRGRAGVYRASHLRRLQLIGALQDRGYSLAGIRDLLDAWSGGADLSEVLGLSPDDLVHLDEPGAPATLGQLSDVLPALVPDRLREVLDAGLIDLCGPDRYCVPSPSLLQLTVDLLTAGYSPDQVLGLIRTIHEATSQIAGTARAMLTSPPRGLGAEALDDLASRGRGLLAHGTGRLTIYNLGRLLDDDSPGRRRTRRG